MRHVHLCFILIVLGLTSCAGPTPTPIVPTATPVPPTASPTRAPMVMATPTPATSAAIEEKKPVILGYYTDVPPDQLKGMLDKKDFVFINVHTPYAGEIANTDLFIPYDQLAKNVDKLPLDKNAKILLYCSSGHMSTIGSETLVRLGYTNVYGLAGGMKAWQDRQYPLLNNPK
jgi:rhodanese-related sulfurtransferase